MKNSKLVASLIAVIFLVLSFSTNAQSGKVDFRAEQLKSTSNNSPFISTVGIMKTKTYLKFDIRRGETLRFKIKKKYVFGTIEKMKSTQNKSKSEFSPKLKTNDLQLNL